MKEGLIAAKVKSIQTIFTDIWKLSNRAKSDNNHNNLELFMNVTYEDLNKIKVKIKEIQEELK